MGFMKQRYWNRDNTPGESELTRIPRGPSSHASERAIWMTADFDALYAVQGSSRLAMDPDIEAMRMIEPGRCILSGEHLSSCDLISS